MKPFAVLLASHGNYAREALRSAEMIIGRQENVRTMSIDLETSIPAAKAEFHALINELDTDNGLLILTDIVGGTPSNLAAEKLITNTNGSVQAIAGFHLPMLLELFSGNRDKLEAVSGLLYTAYMSSFVDLNKRMTTADEEDSL